MASISSEQDITQKPCFCALGDPHCRIREINREKATKLQLAKPTISQIAKSRPWFLFSVPLPSKQPSGIGKVRNLRGRDILLNGITKLGVPFFHLRNQWRKADAENWYIPGPIECFCARRSTYVVVGGIILGTLVYCAITRPSWIRLFIFLFTPEWILGPFYLLALFLLPAWVRLAHVFGHGSLKVVMQRLYGPGVWLAFTILTLFSCRVYDFALDLLFNMLQINLDGKRKLKLKGDSMLKERLEERRKELKMAREKELEGGRAGEKKPPNEDLGQVPSKISTKRKFNPLDEGDLPCIRCPKAKALLATQNFSFKPEQKETSRKRFHKSSKDYSPHIELLDSKPWLTKTSDHISKGSDVLILGYIYLTMFDCLLRLTRLNGPASMDLEEEVFYLGRSIAALYAGLGVCVRKGMDQNQLDDALQGYKSPSRTMVYWVSVFASAASLMYCESRISALGLSTNASIIQVGLWKFLWPYEWIKRSTARIYSMIGLWTLVAMYFSLQEISRRRLYFLRLWRYVPLPVLNFGTASTGTVQLMTWEFAFLLILVVLVTIFLAFVSFLGWIRGFFSMFRTFSSRDAASLGVSGMEYEQLVCAAGSVFMFLVKAADWNFYKRGYNQYQGNIMEMVDFAFRHQTQSEQIYPKSLPLRSSAANIRSPIIQVPPAKRICLPRPQEQNMDITSIYPTHQYFKLKHPEILKQLQNYEEGMDMIRILVLHPSTYFTSKIRCNLYHTPLHTQCDVSYDALSYCWGNQNTSCEIEINNASFSITPNLESALRRLRYCDIPRNLWVDAICINQGSDEEAIKERNYQVGMMRRIYQCCGSVRVWLGEEGDESDTALKLISQLSKASDEQSLTTESHVKGERNIPRDDIPGVPPMYDRAYTSFVHLMRRVYFQRCWIIQEVVLAPTALIFCGSSTITPTWNELEKAFNYAIQFGALNMYRQLLPQNFIALQTSRQAIGTREENNRKLSVLLSRHRPSMATNPHDKIYALLGLCDEGELRELDLDVDYNLPLKDLFSGVAAKIIQHDKNLDILSATILHMSEVETLPSWVPDWSLSDPPRAIRYNGLDTPEKCMFRATLDSSYELEVYDNTLIVQGQIIDAISDVGMVYSGYEKSELSSLFSYFPLFCDEVRVLSNWQVVARTGGGEKYMNGEDMSSVYRQVINGGFNQDNASKPDDDMKIYIRFFKYLHFLHLDYFEWTYKPLMVLLLLAIALLALMKNIFGLPQKEQTLGDNDILRTYRRIFRTKTGYVGLGHKEVEVGDFVVLVKGAKVPLVLRQKESKWGANGDCYLHGIMDGNAFREEECRKMEIS